VESSGRRAPLSGSMLGMPASADPFDAIAFDGDGCSTPMLQPEEDEAARRRWRALNDAELPTIPAALRAR